MAFARVHHEPGHGIRYHLLPVLRGKNDMAEKNRANSISDTFREKLGDRNIELSDFRVDDLRKIASEYKVSGSHDMPKTALVEAINRARKQQG
jgi:hypothetical protein